MAKLTTYAATGNREDLSDIIKNISPEDTPIYSTAGDTKATGTYHEWIEEELASPGANAQVEGDDITAAASSHRTRVGNYTQVMWKAYGVTGTQEAVNKAGIKSQIARDMTLAMKEIANDVEYAYVNNASKVAGGAITARELGGVSALVTTNVNGNAGTPRGLTETLFNDTIETCWTNGGKPDTSIVSGKNKRNISSTFTGVANSSVNIDASKSTIKAGVTFYESDFGVIKIVASTKMADSDIFFLQTNMFRNAKLRDFKKKELPVSGDRTEQAIIGELTLECLAEKSSGILTDLDGTVL